MAPPSLVAAPNPTAYVGKAEDYKMPSGKYLGRTLGELALSDAKYVQYLRASGSPEQKTLADQVLTARPAMPEPVKSEPVVVAPSPVSAPLPAAPAVDQKAMVAECKVLMAGVKEFQGAGIGRNMIPFLRSIGGAKFDYTEWTVSELHMLKIKLNEKLGNS